MMQNGTESGSGAHATLASLAAVGSVLAASACCLPLFPFMMAAGLAGSSVFLSAARPYLLASSILFIAYGFYQVRRAKQCRRAPRVINSALLWTSTFFVFVSIFFPQAMANAAAGFAASQVPAGQAPLESLTSQNVSEIENAFNTAKNDVRVLLLLSPT